MMWEYTHHKGCILCTKLLDFQVLIGVCQIQNEGTFINFMSKHDAHILHYHLYANKTEAQKIILNRATV